MIGRPLRGVVAVSSVPVQSIRSVKAMNAQHPCSADASSAAVRVSRGSGGNRTVTDPVPSPTWRSGAPDCSARSWSQSPTLSTAASAVSVHAIDAGPAGDAAGFVPRTASARVLLAAGRGVQMHEGPHGPVVTSWVRRR